LGLVNPSLEGRAPAERAGPAAGETETLAAAEWRAHRSPRVRAGKAGAHGARHGTEAKGCRGTGQRRAEGARRPCARKLLLQRAQPVGK